MKQILTILMLLFFANSNAKNKDVDKTFNNKLTNLSILNEYQTSSIK